MFKLTLMPQRLEVFLPVDSSLVELEFELHGQEAITFGCRSGACGACVIEVLSGDDALGSRGAAEEDFLRSLGFPGEHYRLACQCRLAGDVTVSAARR
ncbi:2Fe-2S iron-sulfur cluster-binding protein [Caballeronia sp. INSB1]|uniref:2Fe-2S iron-sulfur cluster-binding protein n=1 Tax=Caballeronia sp. INSB1 TaxID=2921751 RepID=UPI002032A2A7|nr:2Fe-2S iron-sulfur cluster-binding protein [Caballeronia sp. INSB1]